MAAVVGQTVQGREPPQRDVPLLDTRPVEVEEEEENAEEEVSCYKEVVPQDKVQLDLSSQQQRDVAVLMGDTPSPAPSVVSIRSELTDDEEEDPQKCRLTEWVAFFSFFSLEQLRHHWLASRSYWLVQMQSDAVFNH